jgi:hypothetical protein
LRFFADIRDPPAYEPNRTANRFIYKISNRTDPRSADLWAEPNREPQFSKNLEPNRGYPRFGSIRYDSHSFILYPVKNYILRAIQIFYCFWINFLWKCFVKYLKHIYVFLRILYCILVYINFFRLLFGDYYIF